ncbi:siderophore ABC transporter permease [Wenxinia marina]|uniref:ABC-type Fe3+-siderophore transport system, permease component n=1 Tax=Wenxinia marina DSM 24838 TaxID=1123501 RepID=A0A0D0NLU8_9RHOB|nr:ABC-type Fe3+-siderophore transport system, permease component [Wenxinia marina DSM 24838]GGL71346.1 siderophore ABC transporter permease [Wenxinia marina]
MVLGLAVLGAVLVVHLGVGAKPIALGDVWQALLAPREGVYDDIIVREMRLPRALFAACVGAALSMAGALLQGVTRNPLAEPAVLGLTAGASLAVVAALGWLGLAGTAALPLVAGLGAVGGAALTFGIARAAPAGSGPLTLVLSGMAVMTFLNAGQEAVTLLNEAVFDRFRVWLSGSLAAGDMAAFRHALPLFALGGVAALALSGRVTALAMGDETAAGLGVDVARTRGAALAAVVALTAASVALAGPMWFVGLVVPHAVRLFVGADYRRIVPASALAGAVFLMLVDIVARTVLAPVEVSTGIVTALVGAPVFIALVRARL